MFRFIQYVERQVVLFDALEDAAFKETHDVIGVGTLKELETKVAQENVRKQLLDKLNDFAILLTLTAHPTQFYPGPVLGIINDLAKALKDNNVSLINTYLQQLGKTPLLKKQKPTPYDEAVSLIWYLENVFYAATGRIITQLKKQKMLTSDIVRLVLVLWVSRIYCIRLILIFHHKKQLLFLMN